MINKSIISRRSFLTNTLAATGGAVSVPFIISKTSAQTVPSERIVMGAIGVGGRGEYILSTFLQYPDVQMVAVCDARGDRRKNAQRMVNEHYKNNDCEAYIDARELLGAPI